MDRSNLAVEPPPRASWPVLRCQAVTPAIRMWVLLEKLKIPSFSRIRAPGPTNGCHPDGQ